MRAMFTAWILVVAGTFGGLALKDHDSYMKIRNQAVADRKPLLIYVGKHDCVPCQKLEETVLSNLDTKDYALARIYYDENRARAMRELWGPKHAKSLHAMSQTQVPRLILWLPLKNGKYQKYFLANPPVPKAPAAVQPTQIR